MLFTNLGKKRLLDTLHPDGGGSSFAYRLVLCKSTPAPSLLTEFLDELAELDADCGFPIGGWSAQVEPSAITDDGTVTWELEWVVKRADPGDVAWLVMIDKDRHVLAYMNVWRVFVTSENKVGQRDCRAISIQIFGDVWHG